MQLDRAAVGADRDEQGALQPLGAIFKWRAQTKRLDISRPTSILTREFVSLTNPLVMSSDATCRSVRSTRSNVHLQQPVTFSPSTASALRSLRGLKQAVLRPLLNRRQPGRRKVHHRMPAMPRSKTAKGAHCGVIGARDRAFVEHKCATVDGSDGTALHKAHRRRFNSHFR